MAKRGPGMDHEIYPYAPMPRRSPLRWPDGARVAFWVLLHLEYWELAPPADAVSDSRFKGEFGNFSPDYRTWSTREYGNRIGIYRLLDLLGRYGIKVTVAVNSQACMRYPRLMEEIKSRDWEVVAHGISANRMISSQMSEEEERSFIAESLDTIEREFGQRPDGWLSQDFGQSHRTTHLLADAGLSHLLDWPNDEQPYLTTTEPAMVSIPNPVEWDDFHLLWTRHLPMPRYPEVVQDAFDCLYEEGRSSGLLFGLGIRPWILGMAHRIRYLDEALKRITGREGVWQATAGEIAREFRKQMSA